jgi:hypothetical protein
MAITKRPKISSTDKTTNLDVPVTGELSLDAMETVLLDAAAELGMYLSKNTVLGTKRYPGNRHWHLKQDPRAPGCLDVTYWPAGPFMWISIRNYEPEWVHDRGYRLGSELERRLA